MRHNDLHPPSLSNGARRLVVASANPIWLTGFVQLAHSLPGIALVGVAETARDALHVLEEGRADMFVIDRQLVAGVRDLCRPNHPVPRILVAGDRAHAGTRPPFDSQCSCGYFNERLSWPELVDRLAHVAGCVEPRAGAERCRDCPVARSHRPPRLPLTERETQVFERIGWGEGPRMIARALGLQVKTVDAHRESLKHKLGLRSAIEVREAAAAWREGHLLHGVVVQPA
ncbi:MAG: response regulator transcription factor [Dokdonella sp.]|uniref:response regulator transcription factor n=1 Tax=Dokdonella sp. TaxID=2291710 RepID=UPI003F807247